MIESWNINGQESCQILQLQQSSVAAGAGAGAEAGAIRTRHKSKRFYCMLTSAAVW